MHKHWLRSSDAKFFLFISVVLSGKLVWFQAETNAHLQTFHSYRRGDNTVVARYEFQCIRLVYEMYLLHCNSDIHDLPYHLLGRYVSFRILQRIFFLLPVTETFVSADIMLQSELKYIDMGAKTFLFGFLSHSGTLCTSTSTRSIGIMSYSTTNWRLRATMGFGISIVHPFVGSPLCTQLFSWLKCIALILTQINVCVCELEWVRAPAHSLPSDFSSVA